MIAVGAANLCGWFCGYVVFTGNAKPRGEGTGYLAPPRQLRRRLRFIGITLSQL
jgi:hypothetical protein